MIWRCFEYNRPIIKGPYSDYYNSTESYLGVKDNKMNKNSSKYFILKIIVPHKKCNIKTPKFI